MIILVMGIKRQAEDKQRGNIKGKTNVTVSECVREPVLTLTLAVG